jgi:FkbM family methyltransferase
MAAVAFEPQSGYGLTLIRLIDPVRESRLVTVEDVQARGADFEIDFYGFRYRGNTSNLIDAHTLYFGAYEKPELHFLRDTLNLFGPGAIVVDVGANSGRHALFASRYAAQVHAFEPYPPMVARLRQCVEANDVSNVITHPVGLGEEEAVLPFFAPPDSNLGTGSFTQTVEAEPKRAEEHLRVVAGDDYLREAGIGPVSVIKMDIEGYEKPALAGLRNVLARDRPIVLFELTIDPATPGLFTTMEQLRSFFPGDYEFLALGDRDLRTGAYTLQPLSLSFDRPGRANAVARPSR